MGEGSLRKELGLYTKKRQCSANKTKTGTDTTIFFDKRLQEDFLNLPRLYLSHSSLSFFNFVRP